MNTTQQKYKWFPMTRIAHGHRWFWDENSSRVACADNSGKTPDTTDDGVLWLDASRPITVACGYSGATFLVPVTVEKGKRMECCVLANEEECAYLIEWQQMELVLRSSNGLVRLGLKEGGGR